MKPKSIPSITALASRFGSRQSAFLFVTALSALLGGQAYAQTWNGAGANADWSTGGAGGNWTNAAAPVAGATLTFAGTTRPVTNNNLTAGTSFAAINFTNTANGQNFTLGGNSITLGGNITTTTAAGGAAINDTISLDLILSGTRTITANARHNLLISGNISESSPGFSLIKAGVNTLTLQGANSFTGPLQLNQGTISVTSIANSGTNSAAGAGSEIQIGNTTASATLNYNSPALTAASTNRQVRIGSNTSAVGDVGGASFGSNSAIGTGGIVFTNANFNILNPLAAIGRTFTISGSNTDNNEIQGIIANNSASGIIGVTKAGASTWIFSGANTYTGITTITAGTLRANVADVAATSGALGNGGNITFNGGTLQYTSLSAGSDYSARFKNSTAATIRLDTNGESVTLGSAIDSSNTFGLAKVGLGTLTLGVANAYTGTTSIAEGAISLSSFDRLGTSTTDIGMGSTGSSGASLIYTGTGETVTRNIAPNQNTFITLTQSGATGTLNFAGNLLAGSADNRTLILDGVGTAVFSGTIDNGDATRNTTLTKNGAGTWSLTGANLYRNPTNVNQGTLTVSGAGTLGATTGVLNVNNTNTTAAGTNTVLNLSTTLDTIKRSLSGTISAPLSGTNTATINNGGMGRNFTINQTGATTFGGVIAGGGDFTLGSGSTNTLTLSGVNTYTGATLINAGTLTLTGVGSVNNSPSITVATGATFNVAAVTGGYTLGSTQTLAGGGNVTGATIINGTHSPGVTGTADGVGIQTFSSSVSYGTGSIFEWNLVSPATGAANLADSGTFDQVSSTGITGTAAVFKVVLSGGAAFANAFWDTDKSWSTVFTGTAPASLADVFSAFDPTGGLDAAGFVAGRGQFTFNNASSTLNWTAVPEPTSALAGLLLGAGLLRRRRA